MEGNRVQTLFYSVGTLAKIFMTDKTFEGCYVRVKIYRYIIFPAVLYGCETWSLILREERRLRAFGNRLLRRIFGSKRYEVRGEWRRLHNEELNDLYCSPNIVRAIKSESVMGGACSMYWGEERHTQGFGGET
jgi:hypothetical protein